MTTIPTCTRVALLLVVGLCARLHAQGSVSAHVSIKSSRKLPSFPAVLWLEPVARDLTARMGWKYAGPYRLVQKNKMFMPHLLIVPVGTSIAFPNADPFFHSVFSLFDGERFDLGLYEAGTSKEIRFERPGISYLFCNIHPQMSAVVVVLQNPLFAIAKEDGSFLIQGVPQGEYSVHLWVEGADEHILAGWTHHLSVTNTALADAGGFSVNARSEPHLNEFGKVYKPETPSY